MIKNHFGYDVFLHQPKMVITILLCLFIYILYAFNTENVMINIQKVTTIILETVTDTHYITTSLEQQQFHL